VNCHQSVSEWQNDDKKDIGDDLWGNLCRLNPSVFTNVPSNLIKYWKNLVESGFDKEFQ
jgi:hypothetical protein